MGASVPRLTPAPRGLGALLLCVCPRAATFMDAVDLPGDRAAVLFIAFLISLTNMATTDLGIGRIASLQWLDVFNVIQMALTAIAVIETVVVHILIKRNNERLGRNIDWVSRRTLPILYCSWTAGSFMLSQGEAPNGDMWLVIGINMIVISACVLVPVTALVVWWHYSEQERLKMKRVSQLLEIAQLPEHDEKWRRRWRHCGRKTFASFDIDSSGELDMDEIRNFFIFMDTNFLNVRLERILRHLLSQIRQHVDPGKTLLHFDNFWDAMDTINLRQLLIGRDKFVSQVITQMRAQNSRSTSSDEEEEEEEHASAKPSAWQASTNFLAPSSLMFGVGLYNSSARCRSFSEDSTFSEGDNRPNAVGKKLRAAPGRLSFIRRRQPRAASAIAMAPLPRFPFSSGSTTSPPAGASVPPLMTLEDPRVASEDEEPGQAEAVRPELAGVRIASEEEDPGPAQAVRPEPAGVMPGSPAAAAAPVSSLSTAPSSEPASAPDADGADVEAANRSPAAAADLPFVPTASCSRLGAKGPASSRKLLGNREPPTPAKPQAAITPQPRRPIQASTAPATAPSLKRDETEPSALEKVGSTLYAPFKIVGAAFSPTDASRSLASIDVQPQAVSSITPDVRPDQKDGEAAWYGK